MRLAFEDDRKAKALRDEMEAEARRALEERVAAGEASTSPTHSHSHSSHMIEEEIRIPLDGGHRLGDPIHPNPPAVAEIHIDAPPAYDDPIGREHISVDSEDDEDD